MCPSFLHTERESNQCPVLHNDRHVLSRFVRYCRTDGLFLALFDNAACTAELQGATGLALYVNLGSWSVLIILVREALDFLQGHSFIDGAPLR